MRKNVSLDAVQMLLERIIMSPENQENTPQNKAKNYLLPSPVSTVRKTGTGTGLSQVRECPACENDQLDTLMTPSARPSARKTTFDMRSQYTISTNSCISKKKGGKK
jgi:hypothetical protein